MAQLLPVTARGTEIVFGLGLKAVLFPREGACSHELEAPKTKTVSVQVLHSVERSSGADHAYDSSF